MSPFGGDSPDLLIRARAGLLDALQALEAQRDAVVVIGAQAVYLRTGELDVALAPATKDSDFSLDPRLLHDDPRIEQAMRRAGFLPSGQPGSWLRTDGIPVDLMVPQKLAGPGRRSASIPPHDKFSARQTRGIEATLVDFDVQEITSLDSADSRSISAKVAGPAALLVAKIHKIVERLQTPTRSNDKDAHDSYRIFRSIETSELRRRFLNLVGDELSRQTTLEALVYLKEHFAAGPESAGSMMAGRAEEGLGDPAQVAMSVAILADDLIRTLVEDGIAIGGL